jgi:hypothetical protein
MHDSMNRAHLLDDEQLPAARMGAYSPPGGSPVSDILPQMEVSATKSISAPASQETYDLQFTVIDVSSHSAPSGLPHVYDDEEEDLPPLPPLISYCGYMRFGCVFAKWPLLVALLNLIAYSLCHKAGYFGYESLVPVDSWLGGLLAGVWLGTAVWAYLCARRVDRDVQEYDRMAQYEQGQQMEDPVTAATAILFIPNYEHIYGRVSRKIDVAFFQSKSRRTEGTSSLVNLSFCLWSVALAAGVFMMTGVLLGKGFVHQCDTSTPSTPSNKPSNSSKTYNNDYSELQSYSSTVQSWAVAQDDPYSRDYGIITFMDDDVGSGYDFPIAHSSSIDSGNFAELPDGTIFFAGFPPPEQDGDEGKDYVRSDHMILIESPGSGGASIYHKDIVNPLMFIPVENTITKNSKGSSTATQYCFTASKSPSDRNEEKRTWGYIIRTTAIYCIIQNTTSYEIRKDLIAWTDKSVENPLVTAASTGSEILIAHVGADDRLVYQEIVSISPSTMTKKGVYHFTRDENQFINDYVYEYDIDGQLRDSRCSHDNVQVMSVIAAMIVLGVCSAWLIVREGVPAGVAPAVFALVVLVRMCTNPYDSGVSGICLVLGTLFFYSALCCGNVFHLPAWIGRELYVWGLYSWIISFLILYLNSVTGLFALILFCLTGMILNHPIPQIIGYILITIGTFTMIQAPFRGTNFGNFLEIGLFLLLIGLGILGLESRWTSNRRYCAAFCLPLTRAGRALFYGSGDVAFRPKT